MRRLLLFAILLAAPLFAQTGDTITVTATKIEEDVLLVPSSVTTISGEELERMGARDLGAALSLVGGVAVAAGGDGGPAASVPEIWGLREADAYLLVVDGVPWGGAFNPASEAVDLHGVDRIEVVRGSAPVVYGATAFSGVIHVIHRHPSQAGGVARVAAGSFGSGEIAAAVDGIVANIERQRFRDGRTGADRGHLLWRNERQTAAGRWRFDVDALRLQQDPASPLIREGSELRTDFLDRNLNPRDARIDSTRLHGTIAYDATLAGSPWTTTLAATRTSSSILRGFIHDLATLEGEGFTQQRRITDLYFDTHLTRQLTPTLRVVAGLDHLGGRARAESVVFDYRAGADDRAVIDEPTLRDNRAFSAVYAQAEWTPSAAWRLDAGGRVNHARETRATPEDATSRTTTRGSAFAGVTRLVGDGLALFADYRNTFKPAAIDFGPDSEAEILAPETSQSYEVGAKGRADAFSWQVGGFLMDLRNLILTQTSAGGLPVFINGGRERFKGGEVEVEWRFDADARLRASYARHDARFRDFVQDFDGVPAQLAGKRLEMSARDLASLGLVCRYGNLIANYNGPRFLNRRNTVLAGGYVTIDAGVNAGPVRIEVRNLTGRRPPIAESELGDAQYYLQPARAWRAVYTRRF
ncbi:MAG: TonB-dependent receptor [Acidobacteria bacterium]|nr:TonB-dependent receptor [Acidobacteriota bacterium]